MASLRAKLPEDELRATLDQVMAEAGASAEDAGLDFDSFLHMLRVGLGAGHVVARLGGLLHLSGLSARAFIRSFWG